MGEVGRDCVVGSRECKIFQNAWSEEEGLGYKIFQPNSVISFNDQQSIL